MDVQVTSTRDLKTGLRIWIPHDVTNQSIESLVNTFDKLHIPINVEIIQDLDYFSGTEVRSVKLTSITRDFLAQIPSEVLTVLASRDMIHGYVIKIITPLEGCGNNHYEENDILSELKPKTGIQVRSETLMLTDWFRTLITIQGGINEIKNCIKAIVDIDKTSTIEHDLNVFTNSNQCEHESEDDGDNRIEADLKSPIQLWVRATKW